MIYLAQPLEGAVLLEKNYNNWLPHCMTEYQNRNKKNVIFPFQLPNDVKKFLLSWNFIKFLTFLINEYLFGAKTFKIIPSVDFYSWKKKGKHDMASLKNILMRKNI